MATIVCSDCNKTLGKEEFSTSQRKKKATEKRRCISCAKIVDRNSNSNSNSSSNNNPCNHGCTKKEFNNRGEHYKVVEDWCQIDHTDTETCNKNVTEFYEKNQRIMRDPFGRFVIARIADDYLKGKVGDVRQRLSLLVNIRYVFIPHDEGKDIGPESEYTKNRQKYSRDIQTERGRINCIAREIPCECMDEKKKEAKLMAKNAVCFCCRKEFLKEKILRCKGCNHVQYCSKECRTEEWTQHKEICKKYVVSSASATASESGSGSGPLPLFEKPSDFDVDADAEE